MDTNFTPRHIGETDEYRRLVCRQRTPEQQEQIDLLHSMCPYGEDELHEVAKELGLPDKVAEVLREYDDMAYYLSEGIDRAVETLLTGIDPFDPYKPVDA